MLLQMAAVVAVETPAYPQQAVLEEVAEGAIKAAYLEQQDREILVATLLVKTLVEVVVLVGMVELQQAILVERVALALRRLLREHQLLGLAVVEVALMKVEGLVGPGALVEAVMQTRPATMQALEQQILVEAAVEPAE
jgi:hypothetical protein